MRRCLVNSYGTGWDGIARNGGNGYGYSASKRRGYGIRTDGMDMMNQIGLDLAMLFACMFFFFEWLN